MAAKKLRYRSKRYCILRYCRVRGLGTDSLGIFEARVRETMGGIAAFSGARTRPSSRFRVS